MRDLVLTGFMGTGKTTVARILARRFGLELVDTDTEVERLAGCSIAEIFDRDGEEEFRRLERCVLTGLAEGEGRIIATGGGLLVSDRSFELLQPGQEVVCLACEASEIETRLSAASDRRLLATARSQRIASLLQARSAAYGRFTQVDTTGQKPEDVADRVAQLVRPHRAGLLTLEPKLESRLIFARGAASRLGSFLEDSGLDGNMVVVSDDTVAAEGLVERVVASVNQTDSATYQAILPTGEKHKTMDTVQRLYGAFMEYDIDRRGIVVGVGGGVVCDLAGMLAATYLRGLRLVLVPTTLLAQVDAAIGGKVGVDVGGVKNLAGSFYPANLVVIDPDLLVSLPTSALSDGLAEVTKIAAVRSLELFDLVEALPSTRAILEHPAIVRRAAREKLRVVERDPFEQGERAMLNFGHTIGHAVEAASGYEISHGRAISIGMVAEASLAAARNWCTPGLVERLARLLARFDLPTRATGLSTETVLSFVGHDKKRTRHGARFALPTAAGRGDVFQVTEADVRDAVSHAVGGRRDSPEPSRKGRTVRGGEA